MSQLHELSLTELRGLLQAKKTSPAEIIDAIAARAERVDPVIGGYVHFDAEAARKEAAGVDLSLPLGGIPVAIKDVISVKGQPCGCASKILTGYIAPYDATAITRLRAAGAVPLGRANMDEFAMGSSTENSAIKITRNPWDTARIPGGSSGGSAAVVAAREAVAALGSDTGGSIRQPAALCGIVGLKPSYGRVSRYGLVAFASSLDQIGPMTRTVEDAALLFKALAGHDPMDSTSLAAPVEDPLPGLKNGVKGLRIGLPKEYFVGGIEPGVEKAVRGAIKQLESLGAEAREISLPHTEYAVATYYIIATAEASANLARFDGVRYGHRTAQADSLIEMYGRTREEGFGPEVKRRIILGTYVLSSGYYDAYYLRAQKARTLIRNDFLKAFEQVDVIACPATPTTAFRLGEKTNDPLQMYLADIFTIAANLAGICGLSLPCGFSEDSGARLPVGLQLLGPALGEAALLRAAWAYEQAAGWHKQAPSI